jgi:hypothetical protein
MSRKLMELERWRNIHGGTKIQVDTANQAGGKGRGGGGGGTEEAVAAAVFAIVIVVTRNAIPIPVLPMPVAPMAPCFVVDALM